MTIGGIADPLLGSVHDPIYQGPVLWVLLGFPSPSLGPLPRPTVVCCLSMRLGNCTPIQMNKLLKVLEDRKVFLESAYYSSEDSNIPNISMRSSRAAYRRILDW